MEQGKATLGIYGIQDRSDHPYPQYVHDHSLVMMHEGKVENMLQLERYSRIKRDNKMHRHLTTLVREAGWVDREADVVFVDNVVGRSLISSDGQIRFEAPLMGRLTKTWEQGRLWWFKREMNAWVLNHELAHVFSCLPFFGEFEENSLLIHFDGGASLSNFSAWMYRMGKIIPVEHHWELKQLTSLFNANALTFGIMGAKMQDQNSVPGKLMGYAALGNYNEDIEFWLRQNKWFEDCWSQRSAFFERAKADFNIDLQSFDQHNTFLQDVVATIQEVFMRATLMKIDDVNTLSSCKNLYYTGGCALNIHTNSAIIESGIFDHVYIPPCTEDSGLALGAAAFGEWMKGNHITRHSVYLNGWGIEAYRLDYSESDIEEAALLLMNGAVIGTCNEYGEAGPRALGNRSLLALPTKALAKKVSVDMKKREWYRPVAPVMLEKNACQVTGLKHMHHLSKYMLLDFHVLPEYHEKLAGVIHANGTARIQAVGCRDENPYLFDLLTVLDHKYGVKALINTSFNVQGAPMVHTFEDALAAAREMGLNAVVFNGKVHKMNEQAF
jgi:carbamoyltransferase